MTANSTKRSALAAGYVPLDIVSYRGRVWRAAGGTAGNVAAVLGFLGWEASLIADLGDDLAGRQAQRDLIKANVSVELVRLREDVATPRLVHEITGSDHRYLFRCPSCGQRFPTSRPLRTERALELIAQDLSPDVFFLDRLNAGTILLAEHFSSTGSMVVFEPSRSSRPDLTQRAVRVADVIKYSDDRDTGLDRATPRFGQVWVVTSGARGAGFRIGNGVWHESPAFSYPVVDAGGAGDWTTAGLIHTLPLGERLTSQAVGDALRWAQALAAVSCGAPGARGLARRQTADAVLRAAKFLELRGEQFVRDGTTKSLSRSPVPGETCKWCLQATHQAAGNTATVGPA